MSKIKQLLINYYENEEAVSKLLARVEIATPVYYELLCNDDLPSETMRELFNSFTNDEEIINLTINYVEMDICYENYRTN